MRFPRNRAPWNWSWSIFFSLVPVVTCYQTMESKQDVPNVITRKYCMTLMNAGVISANSCKRQLSDVRWVWLWVEIIFMVKVEIFSSYSDNVTLFHFLAPLLRQVRTTHIHTHTKWIWCACVCTREWEWEIFMIFFTLSYNFIYPFHFAILFIVCLSLAVFIIVPSIKYKFANDFE